MGSVKLAVSLPEPLFEQLESVAHESRVPRSRVVARALEDYLRRRERARLRERINAAYADGPDAEEAARGEAHRRLHREVLEAEEW